MSLSRWFVVAAAVGLGGCAKDFPEAPSTPSLTQATALGFRTAAATQARALVSQATLTPLITTGDLIPGTTLPWAPTPDGLGAYSAGGNLIVFSNHELTATGVTSTNGGPTLAFARVSRLTIDPVALEVTGGDYAEDGSGGYIRFCSGTWVDTPEGFTNGGYFLTGEENGATNNGSSAVAFGRTGGVIPLPHLGALSHENTIVVPGFGGKLVAFGFDDSAGQSELYMYVGATAADLISGQGKLYVMKTDVKSTTGTPLHSGNMVPGRPYPVSFAEISDPADLGTAPAARYANLQSKVDALGAMPFVRIEDGDYNHANALFESLPVQTQAHHGPIVYFVDTGSETVTGRTAVGADCGGVCDRAGSLYSVELNRSDPTQGGQLRLLRRSTGVATGWASPDNIAVSENSIMVMEDPANTQWDGRRVPGIWNAPVDPSGQVGPFREVVEVTQEQLVPAATPGAEGRCIDAQGTCWETSGIIGTAPWLGPGTWLFNVQAHTLPFSVAGATTVNYKNESGQLLYLRIPGS